MKNLIADMESNQYVAGVRQVNRHLLEHRIKKIYLACDCEDDFAAGVRKHAAAGGVPLEECGTRHLFAELCGIKVPCGVIGILSE